MQFKTKPSCTRGILRVLKLRCALIFSLLAFAPSAWAIGKDKSDKAGVAKVPMAGGFRLNHYPYERESVTRPGYTRRMTTFYLAPRDDLSEAFMALDVAEAYDAAGERSVFLSEAFRLQTNFINFGLGDTVRIKGHVGLRYNMDWRDSENELRYDVTRWMAGGALELDLRAVVAQIGNDVWMPIIINPIYADIDDVYMKFEPDNFYRLFIEAETYRLLAVMFKGRINMYTFATADIIAPMKSYEIDHDSIYSFGASVNLRGGGGWFVLEIGYDKLLTEVQEKVRYQLTGTRFLEHANDAIYAQLQFNL